MCIVFQKLPGVCSVDVDACVGDEIVYGCMAMFTLGCRNGADVCGRVDVIEMAFGKVCRWLETSSSGGSDYDAGAAASALAGLTGFECAAKMSPECRRPMENEFLAFS